MEMLTPLDQLRPNHLPDPVGFWPPAIGWWVLTIIVVALITFLTLHAVRRWRKKRYRTVALQETQKALADYQEHQTPVRFAQDCNVILKKVALRAFPQKEVASLSGDHWCQFLAETGGTPEFLNHSAFNNDRYNPNSSLSAEDIFTLTRRWIKKHHA
ncbi:DUF4381 domain-containing protein [Endozoicomonas sp.]|uniref:DUF4381 domain-containing protein n=1 Tax=Endozoicomonas sp. TaxID=1892382 RepID=UPI003AF703C2